MKKFFILLLVAAALLGATAAEAAGYTFALGGFANRARVTNVDDDSVTNVNAAMAEYLFEELAGCDKIILLDETPVTTQARADEISVQLDLGSLPPEYKEVQAEYIICGYLSNVGVDRSSQGLLVAAGRSERVRLDAAVRVLEAKTGRQVYAASGKGMASARELKLRVGALRLLRVGDSEFSTECYTKALREAVKNIALKLKRDI